MTFKRWVFCVWISVLCIEVSSAFSEGLTLMPFYQYKAKDSNKCCDYCCNGFELLQKSDSEVIKNCSRCGAPVKKLITDFSIGLSKSGLDRKAKEKGFHKLKRLNKGEYEKEY